MVDDPLLPFTTYNRQKRSQMGKCSVIADMETIYLKGPLSLHRSALLENAPIAEGAREDAG
jgi:hypothetical protein